MGYTNLDNVFGYKIPDWVYNQLMVRSKKNSESSRDESNLAYLSNKTAWVRLVSSIDIKSEYRERLRMPQVDPAIVAKQYILFGGTSAYTGVKDSRPDYFLRRGIETDGTGAYAMLGEEEVRKYGYRPMPGIKSVKVITQGKLGSIRSAEIQFSVNDKMQLDLIDMLYFKLGYSMFLEWGNTYYYKVNNQNVATSGIESPETLSNAQLKKSEDLSIDPFEDKLDKDSIRYKIMKNVRESEGNYDAMLGIVTNFNFVSNVNGGYDCTLKLQALGYLGESIRINGITNLPTAYLQAIKKLANAITNANEQKAAAERQAQVQQEQAKEQAAKNDPKVKENYPKCVQKLIDDNQLEIGPITEGGTQIAAKGKKGSKWTAYAFYINSRYTYNYTRQQVTKSYECDKYNRVIDSKTKEPINVDAQVKTYEELLSNIQKEPSRYTIENVNNRYSDADITDKRITDNIDGVESRYYLFERFKKIIDVKDDGSREDSINKITVTLDLTPNRLDVINATLSDVINPKKGTSSLTRQYTAVSNLKIGDGSFIIKDVNADKGIDLTINNIFNQRQVFTKGIVYESTTIIEGTYKDEERDWRFDIRYTNEPDLISNPNKEYEEKDITFYGLDKEIVNRKNITAALSNYLLNKNSKYEIIYFWPYGNESDYNAIVCYAKVPVKLYSTKKAISNVGSKTIPESIELVDHYVRFTIAINDLSLIESVDVQGKTITLAEEQANPANTAQAQSISEQLQEQPLEYVKINADELAKSERSQYRSQIECILRTIQFNTLSRYVTGEGGSETKTSLQINWTDNGDNKKFLKSIHENGAFSEMIDVFANPTGNEVINDYITKGTYFTNTDAKFKVEAYYGFHRGLMKNPYKQEDNSKMLEELAKCQIDYKNMFRSLVIPYYQSQDLFESANIHYPCYIPLSWFFFLINHCCLLYEQSNSRPIFYLDFNTESNLCQSNDTMLCTDPYRFIVPFTGNVKSFSKLFEETVLNSSQNQILAVSGSSSETALWSEDALSKLVPNFKKSEGDIGAYRGRFLNCLVSIDYLLRVIRSHSSKEETNAVYFKTMMEEIIADFCKYTGTYNYLRLAYDDDSNCFYVIDDQDTPSNGKILNTESHDLPLYGKESIATSLQISTETSTRIASVIGISANADVGSQTTNGIEATSFGNTSVYAIDRYKKNISAISASNQPKTPNDTEKEAAMTFNYAIDCFYRSAQSSEEMTGQATNYYIDRVLKAKNKDSGSKGTQMLPLGLSFSTDGISGLGIMNGFTVDDELLPYSYTTILSPSQRVTRRVGFVVTGLDHTIEGNRWITAVKSSMYFLKSNADYQSKIDKQTESNFQVTAINQAIVGQTSLQFGNFKQTNINPSLQSVKSDALNTSDEDEAIFKWAVGTEGTILYVQWDIYNWRTGHGSGTITLADSGKVIKLDARKSQWPSGLNRATGTLTYTDIGNDVENDGQGAPRFNNGKVWNPRMSKRPETPIITREDADADLRRRIKVDFKPTTINTLRKNGIDWSTLPLAVKIAMVKACYGYGNVPQFMINAYKSGGQTNLAAVLLSRSQVPNNTDYGAKEASFLLS